MARAPARKKGASRNTRSGGGSSSVPGWTWLLLGLALGLFIAFLWYLWDVRAADSRTTAPAASAAPAAKSGKDSKAGQAPRQSAEETRFEFYTLLPNQEVMSGRATPAPEQPAPPAKEAAPASAEPAYVLQAGSFRSAAEADRRRAAILLLGLPVRVVQVPVKPGETWYRVVVGPFAGKAAAQTARGTLQESGVDTLVIKQG